MYDATCLYYISYSNIIISIINIITIIIIIIIFIIIIPYHYSMLQFAML